MKPGDKVKCYSFHNNLNGNVATLLEYICGTWTVRLDTPVMSTKPDHKGVYRQQDIFMFYPEQLRVENNEI